MWLFVWDTAITKVFKWDTQLSKVFEWDTNVIPSTPSYPTESIVYVMEADSSWNIYVPSAWYNTSWRTWVSFSWNISVDWWATTTTYSGSSSSWGKKTLSWYTEWTLHTIMITPVTEAYQWAKAYGWYSVTWRDKLKEVLYDWSYMWYWTSATSTWHYFRYNQYYGCSSLTTAPIEVISSTVTSIWDYFRYGQFYQCSSLTAGADEVIPDSVTSIGKNFRGSQYAISGITTAKENNSNSLTSIGSQYRYQQYNSCNNMQEVNMIAVAPYSSSYRRTWQFINVKPASPRTIKVYWDGGVESIYNNAWLWQTSNLSAIYVPNSLLSNYQSSRSSYRSIIVWY